MEMLHQSFEPSCTYMSDEEVWMEVNRRGEQTFEQLPDYLQFELRIRNLTYGVREPSDMEQWETNHEWIESRKQTPTTISDLLLKYNLN